ncbi:MAG: tetratricopeptide repeat protein, partial [Desulfobulbaceae bacterium]|nr:tetratricopeptide repeat protein [Desulfobulbaceae bacterium]
LHHELLQGLEKSGPDIFSAGRLWEDVLALGRFFLAAGEYSTAEELCFTLLHAGADPVAPLVLLQHIYGLTGETEKKEEIEQKVLSLAEEDPALRLRTALLYRKYLMFEEVIDAAHGVSRELPDSHKAWLLLAEAKEYTGQVAEALNILSVEMPGHTSDSLASLRRNRLLFRTGRYEEAMALTDDMLARFPDRPDLLLIKARVLWAKNRWQEAIEVYQRFLHPAIDEIFENKSKERGLLFDPAPRKRTFLEKITFSRKEPVPFLDQVMSPSHAVAAEDENQRGLNVVAASLFADYMWQKRFSNELAARRSVKRREYQQAARQYNGLIRKHPDEESLRFDLAGIYSRLGRLGEEAGQYEEIAVRNPDFPGLHEADLRNRLKLQPRLTAGYGNRSEEGWDDLKAVKKEWQSFSFWFAPKPKHEIDISASTIKYRSTEDETDEFRSKRAFVSYRTTLFEGMTVQTGGGFEKLDIDDSRVGLFSCSVNGEIGDRMESHVSFVREITDDTVGSLKGGIAREDVTVGLAVDLLSNLQAGGDFGFTDFSDGYLTEGYTLWTSYSIFPEPTSLAFRYAYDFKDSREGSVPALLLSGDYSNVNPLYWAPKNYWLNNFILSFKKNLSKEVLGRGAPSYYTLEYSLGHNSEGYAVQTVKGGIFLEWTPHFLLAANSEVTSSKSYRSRGVEVSLIYRW